MNIIIFDLLQDEFDKELQRTQNIDKKAEHFMTIIVLIAAIFIPVIPLNTVVEQFCPDSTAIKCIAVLGFMFFGYAALDFYMLFQNFIKHIK